MTGSDDQRRGRPRLRAGLDDVPDYRAGRPATAASVKLSSNESPFPPLPGVLAAIADAAANVNRYPDYASSRLIEGLAAHHHIAPEHIALGTGSVGLCQQVVQAAVGGGENVVFAWRSFEAYPIVVRVSGASPVPVPLRADESHDLAAMADAVDPSTRAVFLCSPNNPTGPAISATELGSFLDAVADDVVVVLDEAYTDYVTSDDAIDGVSVVREHPNVVTLRTFSKAYGLAGLRVGYAIADVPVARALRKTQVPFGVSSVAEAAALAALAARPQALRQVATVVEQRDRVLAALRAHGRDVPDSQGNFVWLRLGERSTAFAAACEQAGVVVRAFDGEGVRVTIGEAGALDRVLEASAAFG